MNKITHSDAIARNRSELAPQSLLFAAGVILSVVLISIMVVQFRNAQKMSNAAGESMTDQTRQIIENDIMQFDGLTVRGADVLNFCKKHLESFSGDNNYSFAVQLNHANGNAFSYDIDSSLTALKDDLSDEYIKPVTRWKCNVNKNTNGIITAVVFNEIN